MTTDKPETPLSEAQYSKSRRRTKLTTLRLVKLVPEGAFNAPSDFPFDSRPKFRSPRDVYEFMRPFCEREVAESFWVLALNSQHALIGRGPAVITRGILNSSLVHPREVFLAAIAASAAALILVHNHPSGDPTPSADDRVVTDQLVSAGRILDIPVHDHLIIGQGRYVSFAEAGLL